MRHVLFIDDQPGILSGLERMLCPMRSQWRMTFVCHASEAIDVLSAEPVDVIISDMRMPDVDGVALLREVRARWPETVRIILSGYADQGAALRSVPVAHQFLAKPCDPAVLSAKVQDAFDLQDRLSRPELRRLVGGLSALPSAPRSFSAITEALSEPEVSLKNVASIIERDPGCATKLLQLVNSAFFGLPRQVTRVSEAVAYLGASRVRDVVLAAEVADMFHCSTPDLAMIVQEVNEHSALVATEARQRVKPRFAHDAFTAGILHDIGRLALATIAPETYGPIERKRQAGADLVQLENAAFGANHTDVGAYLLRLWGLPLSLIDAVARHHDEETLSPDDHPIVVAVAAAEAAAEAAATSVDGQSGGTDSGTDSGTDGQVDLISEASSG
ncbi:MAG: HDOD domain-containing protein [Micromonosporaceae bacterium]|nr:HDOD domain-containing protein [Micromonosporaceae bacterium]